MRPTTAVTTMSSGLLQRFVKAGLCRIGGMIGGSHKAERCMLSTKSACIVGTVDMLELRLRLNSRYWAKYPEGCWFARIGASGDEKPVEFGNKQRSSCAGYRRDVG